MDFLDSSSGWEYSCEFEVDYGSKEHATMVHAALDVDKELQPDKVKRAITTLADGKLKIRFRAVEARFLRASFSALVDLLILATQIIEEYGQKDAPLGQK